MHVCLQADLLDNTIHLSHQPRHPPPDLPLSNPEKSPSEASSRFLIPTPTPATQTKMADPERDQALEDYKQKLLESREWESKLKALRLEIKGLQRDFDVSEENIKALQSVGQIIGEVLKQLDEERCRFINRTSWRTSWANEARSHRQGIIRPPIRRRLPKQSRQGEAEARRTCRA